MSNWELVELSAKQKAVCALAAQGLRRGEIAQALGYAPDHVTDILSQPVAKAYILTLSAAAEARLEAMFEKSVDVIGDTLQSGSAEEKLKAARLQMEATRRLGKQDRALESEESSTQRLERLAERLTKLLPTYQGEISDIEFTEIPAEG